MTALATGTALLAIGSAERGRERRRPIRSLMRPHEAMEAPHS